MLNMAPVQSDLTKSDMSMNIIRGLETLIRADYAIGLDNEGKPYLFGAGEWAVLTDTGTLVPAGAAPVYNTYPVWAGNRNERSDVHATGMATILMGGRFIYQTNVYDTAATYASGDGITVKTTASSSLIPTKASGTEAVLGRVITPPVNGILTIEVVSN